MYLYHQIKSLHIEITSLCQASCPMCARNHHGGLPNPLLKEDSINLKLYKQIVPEEFIKQLQGITYCGNFGDPILNRELLDILEYTADVNPNIKLDLHTNGSARSVSWWRKLARILPKEHCVHFGIDGLEDTHSLYRVGTDFKKIISNAKAFIAAGGRARWNFITFKHNEHQLSACRELAKDLGFESFHEKQTSRFLGQKYLEVYDRRGNVTHKLEEPTERKIVFLEKETIKNYQKFVDIAKVECAVEKDLSIYIDALGQLWPCCFTGAVPYSYSPVDHLVYDFKNKSRESLDKVLEKIGSIDLKERSIKEIVDSEAWQTAWNQGFEGKDKLHVCARTCGKWDQPVTSQCWDQFLELDTFI